MRDAVALVLHVLDGGDLAFYVDEVVEQRGQQLGSADGGVGLRVEVVEELIRPRHQLFQHRARRRLYR